jgi:hypothetical protein
MSVLPPRGDGPRILNPHGASVDRLIVDRGEQPGLGEQDRFTRLHPPRRVSQIERASGVVAEERRVRPTIGAIDGRMARDFIDLVPGVDDADAPEHLDHLCVVWMLEMLCQ